MRRKSRWLMGGAALAVAVGLLAGCGTTSSNNSAGGGNGGNSVAGNTTTGQAQSAADFFKGKTMQIIVPYSPGGGYDQWARLIAPYMKKYLGLGKVEVVNQPGGGGIVGTNQIYGAKPNGLTIGDTNAGGDVFDQIDGASGVNFDVSKIEWIGRPDNDPHVIAVHANGSYKSFKDLENSKTTIKALATGAGSSDYNAAVITLNAFKVPYTMVAAFSGSKAEKAAFLAGDGDTVSLSASDVAQIPGQATPILVQSTTPFSKLSNVPTVISMAQQAGLSSNTISALKAMAGIMSLGHAFIAPPGVPADRLAAIRAAFQKTLNDPSFIQAATKAKLYVGYDSGQDLTQMAQTGLQDASLLKPLLQAK